MGAAHDLVGAANMRDVRWAAVQLCSDVQAPAWQPQHAQAKGARRAQPCLPTLTTLLEARQQNVQGLVTAKRNHKSQPAPPAAA